MNAAKTLSRECRSYKQEALYLRRMNGNAQQPAKSL